MPALRVDKLRQRTRKHYYESWLWREWCFWRVVGRHFAGRLVVFVAVMTIGTVLFATAEQHDLPKAMFFTWALVFGEPPEEFPQVWPLRILFFVLPIIGLVVILETVIDFALLLRDRRRFEENWCMAMADRMQDHIILIGLGRLGIRVFNLLRALGEPVVVIERSKDNQFVEEVRRDGAPMLFGDARREALLEDANIRKARSVVLATTDDLANLEIALDARRVRPDIRVVLRMFDQNMADKIREGFDIHVAVSQSAISAPTFAMSAIETSIVNTFVLGDRLIVMQWWRVRKGGPLANKTLGEAMRELRFGVVERVRRGGERELFPTPETRLEVGDRLLVQGPFDELREMHRDLARSAEAGTAAD